VLKSALSDLPSAEPVTDELNWVNTHNDGVHRLREIIDAARPQISQLVASVVTAPFSGEITATQMRSWREEVNARVAQDAGFAYQGYVRLKLASVRSFVSGLIASLRGVQPRSPFAQVIEEIVDAWAAASDIVYGKGGAQVVNLETATAEGDVPRWVTFLLAFDVDYRKRRLNFMIEGQNRLYQMFDEPQYQGYERKIVDLFKRSLYERLDTLNRCERPERFSPATSDLVAQLFPAGPAPRDAEDLKRYAAAFVARHRAGLDRLVERLAAEINLDASTSDLDLLAASTDPAQWHPDARREALTNYLGFPFWDVLTFPVMTWRETGEFNEILIDRISPQDANTLSAFSGASNLTGTGFAHFAAFFSRAYRENDYLLGRIHALDRLIDIVCNCARLDVRHDARTILALKQRGFTRILDAEEKHLPNSARLIAKLRASIAELGADQPAG
jgi:patatin-related protein